MKKKIRISSAYCFLALIIVAGLHGRNARVEQDLLVKPYLQLGTGGLKVLWHTTDWDDVWSLERVRDLRAGNSTLTFYRRSSSDEPC